MLSQRSEIVRAMHFHFNEIAVQIHPELIYSANNALHDLYAYGLGNNHGLKPPFLLLQINNARVNIEWRKPKIHNPLSRENKEKPKVVSRK